MPAFLAGSASRAVHTAGATDHAWRACLFIGSMLGAARAAAAQDARILGQLVSARTDSSLALAEVTVHAFSRGEARGTITRRDGAFLFFSLPGGPVTVRVHAAGFTPAETTVLAVDGKTVSLRLRLTHEPQAPGSALRPVPSGRKAPRS